MLDTQIMLVLIIAVCQCIFDADKRSLLMQVEESMLCAFRDRNVNLVLVH